MLTSRFYIFGYLPVANQVWGWANVRLPLKERVSRWSKGILLVHSRQLARGGLEFRRTLFGVRDDHQAPFLSLFGRKVPKKL